MFRKTLGFIPLATGVSLTKSAWMRPRNGPTQRPEAQDAHRGQSMSPGQLLKAAEMKADTSILVHIRDKDCGVSGGAISQVLLQTVNQVLDKVYCNSYWDIRRREKDLETQDYKTYSLSLKLLPQDPSRSDPVAITTTAA
ncbi:hypothetical protein QQF64_018450 [Cirrhinus molitorella]|uniref:Uncharacterized protein n=1 Tax=Cirrhinus molitorella TaxID=172907 RepID=A0ABR3LCL0_9TELE